MQDGPVPELLRRASVILAQEVGRTPSRILDGVLPELAQRWGVTGAPPAPALMGNGMPFTTPPANPTEMLGALLPSAVPSNALLPNALPSNAIGPVTGSGMSPRSATVPGGAGDLQKQAHELLAAVLSAWKPGNGAAPALPGKAGALPFESPLASPGSPLALPGALQSFYPGGGGGQRCPYSGAELPTFPGARDEIRRKAHELIETLLITFNEATGEKGLPAESQVPLVGITAPVAPGETARVTLTVANEESAPADVSLYSTNFVADHGHELPSLRVTILPRATVIPAQGRATFEVSIAVPQQTLKGSYCGLIQAHGNRYFKAVLALDVL